jgi:hypothetical protein
LIITSHREVRFVGTVHAEHPEELPVRSRIGAEPHQRRGDRKAGEAHELAQERGGVGPRIDDAAAGVEDRALGLSHQVDGGPDAVHVALHRRLVGLVPVVGRADVKAAGELHVLRQVDHHRARTAVRGHVEGLVQDARQVVDGFDEIVVLRAVARDADRVAFLERVRADEVGRHLSGDAHDRDRIHHRIGETRHRVRGARPRGHENDADLARGTGIAFRRMHGALLVAHQDVLDLLLMEKRVVDRQHRPARIPEDVLDPLILQGADHHVRPGHHLAHLSCSIRSVVSLFRYEPGNKKGPEGAPCAIAGLAGLSPLRRWRLSYENKRAHRTRSRDPKFRGR